MANVKENGNASKDSSESVPAEMDTDIVEEDKEVKDEGNNKEQMAEGQEIEKEDREEKQDEDEVDDQTSNEHLRPKQQLGTSNVDTNATNNEADRVEESHEEDNKPKDSDHNDVEMHSNSPEPEKSVDTAGKVNEKTCGNDEQGSVGPSDKHVDATSKGSDFIKSERDADNGCTSGSNAGKDATSGGSSAIDVKNLEGVVKDDENTKGMAMAVDDMETINDMSMAVASTERNEMFMFDDASEGGESGTEEEQLAFMKELENLFREKGLEFKAPKFYGEPLNLLKLWRAVIKLGGYDKVTACKLWRQVGESFNPPKTCTTVSWTFRIFYEKALLEYERHKISGGELHIPPTVTEPVSMESPVVNSQASGSGRARRDAAARAMQGWHSQRLLGNGEVGDPIIKDKTPISLKSREKHLKNIGGPKRKKPLAEAAIKASRSKLIKGSSETAVIDVGPPADWVKINVRTTKDCYEVYALVPGLLREEVRVQSDPAGRLVISGEPENADNPWGVTPFKKVVSLPSRIDPHQTSAVVTLHGQLFVRVPFEQSD